MWISKDKWDELNRRVESMEKRIDKPPVFYHAPQPFDWGLEISIDKALNALARHLGVRFSMEPESLTVVKVKK